MASAGLKTLRRSEFDPELDTIMDKPYKSFQNRINLHREKLRALLRRLKREGRRIHIYGASTKGNTILQWCDLDNRVLDCAADRNPEKHGAFTLGTDIPIVSEAKSRALNPDYYLVLPWHFKEEFMERERASLKKGIGFIFLLPAIEVVRQTSASASDAWMPSSSAPTARMVITFPDSAASAASVLRLLSRSNAPVVGDVAGHCIRHGTSPQPPAGTDLPPCRPLDDPARRRCRESRDNRHRHTEHP